MPLSNHLTISCRFCRGRGRVGIFAAFGFGRACEDCAGRGWLRVSTDMWEGEPRESWRGEDGWAKPGLSARGVVEAE